jgi:hypothetical protein
VIRVVEGIFAKRFRLKPDRFCANTRFAGRIPFSVLSRMFRAVRLHTLGITAIFVRRSARASTSFAAGRRSIS